MSAQEAVDEFRAQLGLLVEQCILGNLHASLALELAEQMRIRPDVRHVAPLFFDATSNAHMLSGVLHMGRLLELGGRAKRLETLFTFASKIPMIVQALGSGTFKSRQDADISWLRSPNAGMANVRAIRNKYLAHLDQNLSPDEVFKQHIVTARELVGLYREVLIRLNEYRRILGIPDLALEAQGSGVVSMFELLELGVSVRWERVPLQVT